MKKQLASVMIAGLLVSTAAFAQDQMLSDTRGDLIKDRYDDCVFTLDGLNSCNAPQNLSLSADAFFDFDKAVLKPAGKMRLDQLVADINGFKGVTGIALAGHTDGIGSERYNLGLSERRARAVEEYLATHGIPENLLTTVGYGKNNPVATNATPEGRAQNRRVDVVITTTKK